MTTASLTTSPFVRLRTQELSRAHEVANWVRIDHLFAALLLSEWLVVTGLAVWRSPLTWAGSSSRLHPHVIAAVFLGGLIVALPLFLCRTRPGEVITRQCIGVAQMCMSGLLIHVGDGRIEMHFHIFGSLAFLQFYRDWRVLVTASLVSALDHILRGIWMPESIYGVAYASGWRTVEHAGWIVFEDVFLIYACLRSVREIRGIAEHRARLEESNQLIEQTVDERTRELRDAQGELMKAVRSAGMAEIATSVLHNVGNVLNSVNVSATLVAGKLRESEVSSLARVGEMIQQHRPNVAAYIADDERGKMLPDFISELAHCLVEEQAAMLAEVTSLASGIEHIKQIVAAQQSMARRSTVLTLAAPAKLFESALKLQDGTTNDRITIEKGFADVEPCWVDQQKVMQILINLIRNARQAVALQPPQRRRVALGLSRIENEGGAKLRFVVSDSGAGIATENLSRIFAHGFTTKKDGHGFGLHGAANAAREMDGSIAVSSEGSNRGATFTLEIPFIGAEENSSCNA